MESITNGWVVINLNHPSSKREFMIDSTFSQTRTEAIKKFIEGTNTPWNHWKKKWNYKVVRASSTITTTENIWT